MKLVGLNDKESCKKKIIIASVISVAYWGIVFLLFDVLYGLNDDVMMESILSGGFTGEPNGRTYYLSYMLSVVLAFLYRVNRSVPWLGLFQCGCYFVCFWAVCHRVLQLGKNLKEEILGCCLAILGFTALCLPQFILIHYTVVSAMVGATGIFLIGTTKEDAAWYHGCCGYVFLIIAFLVRRQVFLLMLPFAAGVLLYKLLLKSRCIDMLKKIGIFGGIILVFALIHSIAYSQNGWKTYSELNAARTELYDYKGVWQGDAAASFYEGIGLTKDQIDLYAAYDVMLDRQLSTERLKQMAAFEPAMYGIKSPMEPTMQEAIWIYRTSCYSRTTNFPYNYLVLILYIALICASVLKKCWKGLVITGCFGVGRSAVWLYLILQGRMPDRIIVSLYLIEIFTLITVGLLLKQEKNQKLPLFVSGVFILASAVVFLIALFLNMQASLKNQALLADNNRDNQMLYDYLAEHAENLYFMDVYAAVDDTRYAIKDSRGDLENHMMVGGWVTGSPWVNDKLKNWGYADALDAMLNGENVYFVKHRTKGISMDTLDGLFSEGTFVLTDSVAINENRIFDIYYLEK